MYMSRAGIICHYMSLYLPHLPKPSRCLVFHATPLWNVSQHMTSSSNAFTRGLWGCIFIRNQMMVPHLSCIHWYQGLWGQHGAHLGPTGPRLAPCWPHEFCYLGSHHLITTKRKPQDENLWKIPLVIFSPIKRMENVIPRKNWVFWNLQILYNLTTLRSITERYDAFENLRKELELGPNEESHHTY